MRPRSRERRAEADDGRVAAEGRAALARADAARGVAGRVQPVPGGGAIA
ncbi:hypothetical protein [Streptomyces albidoflavus]|nr:hypothetical protein [Streptomyces albidoflavus]